MASTAQYYNNNDDAYHCLASDAPPAKRRKLASPVACCDPACLHLHNKPCYDRECRPFAGSYLCPDICERDICPDTCDDPPCTDNSCIDTLCKDDTCQTACPDPCLDLCTAATAATACPDFCHAAATTSVHDDSCLPTCDLTACSTDPCLDYDCHNIAGLFDPHPCHYWSNEPCFDLSSLSSASPYEPATFSSSSNTASLPANDHGLLTTAFGHFATYAPSQINSNTYPVPRPTPPTTSAPPQSITPETVSVPTASSKDVIEVESTPEQDSSTPQAHVCQWAGCTEGPFSSTELLHSHVKSAHSAKTASSFVCMWAGCETQKPDGTAGVPYSAATKNHFHRHMQRHTGFAPHKCATCDRCFKTPQQLNNHLKTHTGEKQFKCAYCSKSFALLDPLRIHERVHKNEKRFKCPICGDRGADSSNMSAHKRDIHGVNGIPCPDPTCEYRDSRAERLKNHIREANHQAWRLDDSVAWAEYCRQHRGGGAAGTIGASSRKKAASISQQPAPPSKPKSTGVMVPSGCDTPLGTSGLSTGLGEVEQGVHTLNGVGPGSLAGLPMTADLFVGADAMSALYSAVDSMETLV